MRTQKKHVKYAINLVFGVLLITSADLWSMGIFGREEDPVKKSDVIKNKAGAEMVAQQLLVKFDSENAALERAKLFEKHSGKELERVGSTPLFLVQFDESVDLLEVKEKLEHEEGVSYAEPHLVMRNMPAKATSGKPEK